jgi:hypothetical protein
MEGSSCENFKILPEVLSQKIEAVSSSEILVKHLQEQMAL